jgi:CheY-like chemotaxis protein
MPGLSGLETAQRIRQQEREKQVAAVPIVALSASVLEEDRNLASEAGMDGFTAKPIERAVLLREIGRVLGIGPIEAEPGEGERSRPVFDRAGALLRWDDDWVVLADMLGKFFVQNRDVVARLDGLLAKGQSEAALDLAHKVKGLAGNIGLMDLFGALAVLEGMLVRKAGDPDSALEAVAVAMDAAWRLVEPELAPATGGAAPETQRPFDAKALEAALASLKKAVTRGALDDDALNAVVAMLPAQDTQPLRQALEDFDFSTAEALIDGLKKKGETHVG